jgi:hypothetical protein
MNMDMDVLRFVAMLVMCGSCRRPYVLVPPMSVSVQVCPGDALARAQRVWDDGYRMIIDRHEGYMPLETPRY